MQKNTFFSLLFLHFGLMKLGFSKRSSWLPLLSLLILKRDLRNHCTYFQILFIEELNANNGAHCHLTLSCCHCQHLDLCGLKEIRDHDKAIFWLRTVFFTFDLIWSFFNIRLTTWGPDNKGKIVKVFTFYLLLLCQPILQSVIIATLKSSSSTTSWTLSVPS